MWLEATGCDPKAPRLVRSNQLLSGGHQQEVRRSRDQEFLEITLLHSCSPCLLLLSLN
jgi:hypothetical protein